LKIHYYNIYYVEICGKADEEKVKIGRFVSHDERVFYGVIDSDENDIARIVEGDIFNKYNILGKTEAINRILPPLVPPNILCLGLNYGLHAEETKVKSPESPVLFLKGTNSIVGHGSPIVLPKVGSEEVDFEAELAIIIGKKAKNVSKSEAIDCVFGYTCANDVSARDWQIFKQKQQWARGKSFDTFCPIGPYIVTKDEIENPDNLAIRAILNGEVMQDSNTSDMLFDVSAIISDLSQSMTLYAGTVILTGTPEGVGFTREPPVFLKDGDSITVFIEGIGELTNPVKKEE
jgi:2-keto-4-pentenoate hydratase/2-oxohepta-3-ene-1,7-dioic acid hydratase in catechol pathway